MAQCLAHAKAQSGGKKCADHGVPNTEGSEVDCGPEERGVGGELIESKEPEGET